MSRMPVRIAIAAACVLSSQTMAPAVASAQDITLSELANRTHFHGIAVDAGDADRIILATHHGLFSVDGEGRATLVSDNTNDYMGFTPHPTKADVFYASGHPATGGNTGFIGSTDGGRTWRQLSSGAGGPVDFHQMDVSRADPNVVYGVFRGLQISRDAGVTWQLAGPLPDGVIDLAASAKATDRLYLATKSGLLFSDDAGKRWQPTLLNRSPVTMIQTGHRGELYAFVLGAGLLRAMEPELRWKAISNDFGERYMLHLAVDPAAPGRLFAVTNNNEVLASNDAGESWVTLSGARTH